MIPKGSAAPPAALPFVPAVAARAGRTRTGPLMVLSVRRGGY
jgi:hypothetical protein